MQTEPSWSHAAINSFFVSSSLNVIIVCLICFYKDLNSHRRRKVCCLLLKPPDSQLLFSFCRITKPHTRRSPAQEVSAHHIRLKLSPIRCLKIILELPWDFSRIFFFFSSIALKGKLANMGQHTPFHLRGWRKGVRSVLFLKCTPLYKNEYWMNLATPLSYTFRQRRNFSRCANRETQRQKRQDWLTHTTPKAWNFVSLDNTIRNLKI